MLPGLRLRDGQEPVTFVDPDQASLDRLREHGFIGVLGDPADRNILARAGASDCRALIALWRSPKALLGGCRLGREAFEIPAIIARVDDPQVASELQRMKVRVVQTSMSVALALEGALHFPAAFNILMDKSDNADFLDVLLENHYLDGKPLRRLNLPGDALIMGIQRQGEVLVPHGDTVVYRGDILMLVGSPDSLQEARCWLGEE